MHHYFITLLIVLFSIGFIVIIYFIIFIYLFLMSVANKSILNPFILKIHTGFICERLPTISQSLTQVLMRIESEEPPSHPLHEEPAL